MFLDVCDFAVIFGEAITLFVTPGHADVYAVRELLVRSLAKYMVHMSRSSVFCPGPGARTKIWTMFKILGKKTR